VLKFDALASIIIYFKLILLLLGTPNGFCSVQKDFAWRSCSVALTLMADTTTQPHSAGHCSALKGSQNHLGATLFLLVGLIRPADSAWHPWVRVIPGTREILLAAPTKSGPDTDQGPGGVIKQRTWDVLALVWNQQNYQRLLGTVKCFEFSGGCPSGPPREEMLEWDVFSV